MAALQLRCSSSATATLSDRNPTSDGSISRLKVVEISSFQNDTYFNFLTSAKGLKQAYLDPESQRPFFLAQKNSLQSAADNFAPTVYKKVLSQFALQKTGLDQLYEELGNQKSLTQANLSKEIAKIMEAKGLSADAQKSGMAAANLAPFIGLASGSGISVIINRDNYFYTFGRGRNFGASPGHNALDVSETFYLDEIESFVGSAKELRSFYHALLLTLLQCDTSEQVHLSVPAQAVMTDFLAADANDTAEGDLAELTLLAAYSATTRLVPANGLLIKDHLHRFFPGNRSARRNYQLVLSKSMEKLHPELTTRIQKMINAKSGSDLIHSFVTFVNSPSNQVSVRANAPKLVESVSDYLSLLHDEAEILTQSGIVASYSKLWRKPALAN